MQAERPIGNPQFWLAELDQHGNPTLTDGAHGRRVGAEKAAKILDRLGLARGKRFAVAEVRLSELTGVCGPLNEEAIATLNAIGLRPECARTLDDAPSEPSAEHWRRAISDWNGDHPRDPDAAYLKRIEQRARELSQESRRDG